MEEQPTPARVNIRCWKCHARYGPAPLLAVAWAPIPGRDWWSVQIAARAGQTPGRNVTPTVRQQVGSPTHYVNTLWDAGEVRDDGNGTWRPVGKVSRLVLIDAMGAVQLDCPRRQCTARPRESYAALVKLASEAAERGERVVYV
jgi:hypothetical protein